MTDHAATFRTAFLPYRAQLEESCSAYLRGVLARAIADLGPALRNAYNDSRYARLWTETMKYVIANVGGPTGPRVYAMDEALLAKFVGTWATAELEDAALKLAAKVADLRDVRVTYTSGSAEWFTVVGTRGAADAVRVSQSQILNVSSRGKVFNQWPALIYVNGKKVSEAAYKRG